MYYRVAKERPWVINCTCSQNRGVRALLSVSTFISERVPRFVVSIHALLVIICHSPPNSCDLLLCKLKDGRVVFEVHLARYLSAANSPYLQPSVPLAVMKALVSTGLRSTAWSTMSELTGKTTTTLCFPPFQCTWTNTSSWVPNGVLWDWRALIQVSFNPIQQIVLKVGKGYSFVTPR